MLTCRTEQYREAVRPQGGAEVTLRAAAAVQLCPLDANAVRGYLCDDAAGPVARARWAPVLAMLGTEAPAGQALDTPLMVGLARSIYNPRPGELAGTLRDPAELCRSALADRTAVNPCCSTNSSLPPTGMIGLVAGGRRMLRAGWSSWRATSSARSPVRTWPGGSSEKLYHALSPNSHSRSLLGCPSRC